MDDKILQLLASSVIFIFLLSIIVKLYYYYTHISPGKKHPITLEMANAISYAVSVPGDIEIFLPAYIVYENKEGDPYSVFATELKINNKEREYKIVYGVCYYKELQDEVKEALVDSVTSAIDGVLLGAIPGAIGAKTAVTLTLKRELVLMGGQFMVDYFSGWFYRDVDFEKVYLSSLKYFEHSVAEEVMKRKGSRSTAETIVNYAIIGAVAAAVIFDGLGLVALAAATIIARIALPLIYWVTGPGPLENCWYGDNPKNWNFIKMHEDPYFWNPEFSLKAWIIKDEKDHTRFAMAKNYSSWLFINPSPVAENIENQKYMAINEIMLKKNESEKELKIIAFVESE